MSFALDIKRELTHLRIKRKNDAVALMSGFALSIGSLKLLMPGRQWGIHFVSESEPALCLIAKLAEQYYRLERSHTIVRHERLNAMYNELLLYGDGLDCFMADIGLISIDAAGNKSYVPRLPCESISTNTEKRSFVRGVFLACGTVTEPMKAYRAELVCKNPELADFIVALLEQYGVAAKRARRKQTELVYIKDCEQLINLLAFIGASGAVMQISEIRIIKQAKNEANRSVNCISANLDKTAQAALKQKEDIQLILKVKGFDYLPDSLKSIAEVRLNNLEMSLSEIADELGIGKSAVNYRFKRLSDIAKAIRCGERL